jgi:hypothetical protein
MANDMGEECHVARHLASEISWRGAEGADRGQPPEPASWTFVE